MNRDAFSARLAAIRPADAAAMDAARRRQAQLAKPPGSLGKLEDIIQTMSIGQLNRFIVEQKAKGSDMVSMFEVERQNRFAYPMATFVLTVIGVSLSSRKVRGGTGLHIGVGIGLCFTYFLVCKFAAEFAKSSTFFSPILLVWLPDIFYAFIALYLYKKAPK